MRLSIDCFRRNILLVIFFIIQFQKLVFSEKSLDDSVEQEIPPTLSDNDTREGRPWRLPNATYPLKYHLHITTWVHREVFNFTGNVTIELLVKENTSELVLHAEDLQIQEVSIEDMTTRRKFNNLKSRIIDDLLVIEQGDSNDDSDSSSESNSNSIEAISGNFVRNQRLRLEIHYTGVINHLNMGFHSMTYEDANNKTVYGAFTQMEPTFARTVLPCYDEPGLKANFTVHITHGSNYTAISNMPVLSTIENSTNNMTTTSFMETPPMCTYLLAFVISNYEFIAVESDGVMQRVFSPPNSTEHGELALENAIIAVATFARLMDMPYALPKLDHILVRETYGSAMENWGLIIYRDVDFIQINDTNEHKRFVHINTQNHEVVHQWFGNLVSPAWWDSLWLNEGMASYYSHKLTNMMYPDQKILETFAIASCYPRLYGEPSPVSEYVEKPSDIMGAFGTAMYQKAPCIIQMFDHALGQQIFHEGVLSFLKSYAFSIANEDQFFEHIQTALLNSTHKTWMHNITEIMKPWFHAQSLPKVYITRDYSDSSIIHIEQKSASDNKTELWWIPLNFVTASKPNFDNTEAMYYMPPISKVSLNLTELNITLTQDDWLLANLRGTGLYRVFYDAENLLRIAKTLQTNHNVINNFNRAQVLRSISKKWTSGLTIVPVLELLKYLPQEEDPLVWSFVCNIIYEIENLLTCSASMDLFRHFIRNIVAQQYHKYAEKSADELSLNELLFLDDLTEIACNYDLHECVENSKAKFLLHKANIFEAENEYERTVEICNAAKLFNDTEFDETLQLLLNEPEDSKRGYWRYLRCSKNTEQYEKLLQVWLETKVNGDEDKDNLYFLTDNLRVNDKKWNSKYTFLKKQILKLQNHRNSTINLCKDIAIKAEGSCKSYHLQYLELLELCSRQLLEYDIITNKTDELRLGERFDYVNQPEWQLEEEKVYNWLKQENEIYYTEKSIRKRELYDKDDEEREGRSWRLPNTTYPLWYQLHITTWIHREIFNYTGNVTIGLMVKENTTELVLHALGLRIEHISVEDMTTDQKFEKITQRLVDDLLVIESLGITKNSDVGIFIAGHRLRLEIHYTGVNKKENMGFHRMTYRDGNNKTVYGAITQLQPIHARQVLPCYDEPGYKASFIVRITHGSNYTALSNMPAISIEENIHENLTTTSFMETPPMCTHLLAFAITNYEFISLETNGILQRVFTPPNSIERGVLVLENAINALQTFTQYMNVTYPLPKLDHIVVSEHDDDCMENWGLITYHEPKFLRRNTSDVSDYNENLYLLNHELIHQWFGNLVSPAWWDSLWINEGFATYYGFVLTDMVHPELKAVEILKMIYCYGNIPYDLTSIAGYVEESDDLNDSFGTNVYVKAPCILQMFEHAFGEDTFRKGISDFLKTHAYSNANGSQLFDHLQAALQNKTNANWNYSVHEIMNSWLYARTLPIVTITRDYNDSNIIHIRQNSTAKDITEYWWIPMNFATASQPNFENTTAIYFMPPIPAVSLNLTELNITLAADDWLLVNLKGTFFYNVNYDAKNLLRLAKALQSNHTTIDSFNRALVLRSMANMWTEQLSLVPVLEMLKYLPHEQDIVVWSFIQDVLTAFSVILSCTTSNELFKDFMRNNLASQYLRYYEKPAGELTLRETNMMINLELIACDMDLRECLEKGRKYYLEHRQNIIENNMNNITLKELYNAAKVLTDEEFNEALLYVTNQSSKISNWDWLRYTRNASQYEKLLDIAFGVLSNDSKLYVDMFFWSDLLDLTHAKHWNITYTFLKKQITAKFSITTISLCLGINIKAGIMNKQRQQQYLDLLNLCTEQFKANEILEHSFKIISDMDLLGEHYTFERHPQWQNEQIKLHKWLEQENEIFNIM